MDKAVSEMHLKFKDCLEFEIWDLRFIWNLGFEFWNLSDVFLEKQIVAIQNELCIFPVNIFTERLHKMSVIQVENLKKSFTTKKGPLFRRKKEQVIDLPRKIFSIRDVVLTGDQKKRYDEVREELLLRVTSTSGETFVREIDGILEEYLRAVQVASNPRLIDENWNGEPCL